MSENWAVIGIDGGLSGAMVAVDESLRVVAYRDMPVIEDVKRTKKRKGPKAGQVVTTTKRRFDTRGIWQALWEMAGELSRDRKEPYRLFAVLELAQAMPQQGVSSTFKTGQGFGLVEMALVGVGIGYEIVKPSDWMKAVLKNTSGDSTKAKSLTLASRLFPDLPLKTPKGKKLTLDGRSDASLIALYGLRHLLHVDPPETPRVKGSGRSPVKRTPFKRKVS